MTLLHIFIGLASGSSGFHRDECLDRVQSSLQNGSIANKSSIFYQDDSGPVSTFDEPILTIAGCEQMCGKSFGMYKDVGPRLSTWLIPVFLLLSNMEVSPLDKRRYFMLAHLLGDPIDSLWSLLTKLEAWSRCRSMAAAFYCGNERCIRNTATVLGGLEELFGFYGNPFLIFQAVVEASNLSDDQIRGQIARTSQKLADSRTDERLRTILATVLYIYQLVSAFVTAVGGGNTSPPGGRIGIAMFMTWIIPPILVSNAIGCFTSRRICYGILDEFVRNVRSDTTLWREFRKAVPFPHHKTVESYLESFAYSGAIYTYRPVKQLPFRSPKGNRSPVLLLVFAITPVLISSIVGTLILWHTPPIAINCRNLLVFSIIIFIFLSAFFTWATARLGLSDATHWYCVVVKDLCFSVPFVVLVFLATAGRFNTCFCWSGFYTLGTRAHIPLNPVADFIHFQHTFYPFLVSICLSLLIATFIGVMWVGWGGWKTMRWSEKDLQLEWSHAQSR